MQAFLISMHFYQRNMEAMYTETEYLLKEVLNEELHRKQLELNMFYVSRIVVDTVPLTIRVTTSEELRLILLTSRKVKEYFTKYGRAILALNCLYEKLSIYR